METKLFKWRQMDFVSECVLQFYEIELVIDIGTQKLVQSTLWQLLIMKKVY